MRELDAGGALAHGAEIDIERAGPVQGSQRADTIAEAREEGGEFRLVRAL